MNNDDRRDNLRVDISIACHFGTIDQTYPAKTSNLSYSGVLLTLEDGISTGAKIGDVSECEITLGSKTYYIPGVVKRAEGCEVALSFRKLSAEKIEDLMKVLDGVRSSTET